MQSNTLKTMNFNDAFNLVKNNYEKKEKKDFEDTTYELLKKLISEYGYDSVCDEISIFNDKNISKNKELSFFINEIKKKESIELICSQLFYLDDSKYLSQKKSLNDEQIKNKNISLFNSFQNDKKNKTCKFKVFKSKKK